MNRFQPLRMLFAANTLLITFYLVVTTINTLTKPPFSLDRYPYTLSDEAQQSVSQCLVIVDSLDKPITYQARADLVSELNNCLEPTLFASYWQPRLKELNWQLTQAASVSKQISKYKIERKYEAIIEQLQDGDYAIVKLKNYPNYLWERILYLSLIIALVGIMFSGSMLVLDRSKTQDR